MHVLIRGVRWIIRQSTKPMRNYGWCDWGACRITLCRTLRGRAALDTLIHELLHAEFPDLDESIVTQVGTEMANAVWKMGYRKT